MIIANLLPPMATWGIGEWLIFIVACTGGIAVLYAFLNWLGWQPPPLLIKCFGIFVACAIAIICIRLIFSL